jgi:hypothetical protein
MTLDALGILRIVVKMWIKISFRGLKKIKKKIFVLTIKLFRINVFTSPN